MQCNRHDILSSWTIFRFFTSPPNKPENQNFEKKNTWRHCHLTHVCHKMKII